MYVIACYDDRNEIDFLPQKWLVGDVNIQDAIENKTYLQAYWPPWRNLSKLAKAKSKCIDAEVGWSTDTCRILGTAGEYIQAMTLCYKLSVSCMLKPMYIVNGRLQ